MYIVYMYTHENARHTSKNHCVEYFSIYIILCYTTPDNLCRPSTHQKNHCVEHFSFYILHYFMLHNTWNLCSPTTTGLTDTSSPVHWSRKEKSGLYLDCKSLLPKDSAIVNSCFGFLSFCCFWVVERHVPQSLRQPQKLRYIQRIF